MIQLVTNDKFCLFAIGALVAAIAFYFCIYPSEVSFYNGQYHLTTYDSFYHARLIQDTLNQFPRILEFDSRIHPRDGGAWVSVAWGYEYLMAILCLVLQSIFSGLETTTILAYISPVWSVINCFLVIGVCRALGLNLTMTAIGALGFAFSPLTQDTHLIGNIDHHFVELSFILLISLAALRWIENARSAAAAITLGAALGLAHAFHIALFLMYLPLGVTLFVCWLIGRKEVFRSSHLVAISTMACTLLVILPSAHLRQFEFVYYFTSWFHIYWAFVFCLCLVFFKHLEPSRRNISMFVAATILASLPILTSLQHGMQFLLSELPGFAQLEETYSMLDFLLHGNRQHMNQFYSYYTGLVFLLPITIILFAKLTWERGDSRLIFFLVAIVFGATLMFAQLRFKYHAIYILLIPLLVVVQNWEQVPWKHRLALTIVVVSVSFVGAFGRLHESRPLGGQGAYQALLPFYLAIGEQCKKQPGVLLAHPDEGHYLRFHTDCSIVASNLLATPSDFEYKALAMKMLQTPLDEFRQQYDWVDYVYVRREDGFLPQLSEAAVVAMNKGLREDILLNGTLGPDEILYEIPTDKGPFVRLLHLR